MMRVTMKVSGLAAVNREIEALRRQLGLTGAEFADMAARSVRDTVVRNTQPFGASGKAKSAGENAVRGDLFKCFLLVDNAQAARRGVISSVSEAERWHQQRRNGRGRVARGQRRPIVSAVFEAYLRKVQARVGTAKGSVSGGGDARLGGKMQGWVKRWASTGSASRRRSLGGAIWKFQAEPKHVASSAVLGTRGVAKVLREKDKNLRNALRREVTRRLRLAEKRANR